MGQIDETGKCVAGGEASIIISTIAAMTSFIIFLYPDVYTPTTTSVSRIIGAIASKNSKTNGIVLDLSKTSVTADQLGMYG
ncbi:hypothetical protein [Paenibacillus helianthi]|uniref:hypothetical protein n=1 Tax=Paenibacillus helianthi TaxID=1349432 RepID=UPI000AD6B3E1|nr:hypothetical protein [Paenibacillus helianthi]